MKKYSVLYAVLLALCFCSYAKAQDVVTRMDNGEDVNTLFKNQALGGVFIHSEGWGVFFRSAKILSIYNKWFWEIETSTMHNAKEYKIQNQVYQNAAGYYYGKLNGMQVFRFGMGYYKMLYRKNNERCVEIDAVYAAGLSLAVTKPVYLQIIQPSPYPNYNELHLSTEKYDPYKDTPANIYGRASVFDGFGELAFYPGGYARLGLNFDYANRHNTVKAIETGLELDAYPKIIPIMAFTQNYQLFLNLYLSFSIGKRWF